MKKIIVLLSVIIVGLGITNAQNRVIQGYVVNNDNQALDFAIIAIQNMSDSTLIASTQTNENGFFKIETIQTPIKLRVSYIGFQTVSHNVPCSGDTTLHITLNESPTSLKEVVVKASRPIARLSEDGIITQISNTTLANSGTAIDVLNNMPLIQKTNNGFSVFGKGNPIIYVNGRRIYDVSELDGIKSQIIKNVELITNPGSKYDASVSSVIKISTESFNHNNLAIDNRTSYIQSNYSGVIEQITANYRNKKLDLFNSFRYKNMANKTSRNVNQIIYTDSTWNFDLTESENYRNQLIENNLAINYRISDNQIFGSRYIIKFIPKYYSFLHSNNNILANNTFYDYFENNGASTLKNSPSHHLNFFYNTSFASCILDIDFNMFFSRNHTNSSFKENSNQSSNLTIFSSNHISNKFYDAKATLSKDIFGGKFNFGIDYTLTKRKDDYINDTHIVPSSKLYISEQQINPFVEYSYMTIIGLLKLGLRYEHILSKYTTSNHNNFDITYSKLFPNLTFTSKIKNLQWQFSYSTRTKRPSYTQLSNNTIYINRFTLQSGNPFLKPEYIHNISLQGMWRFLQFSFDYQDTHNAIIYWATQNDIQEAVTTISYKNIQSIKRLLATITASHRIGCWNPRITIGINKQFFTLKTSYQNIKLNQPLIYFKFINSFKFTSSLSSIISFNYQSKGNTQNVYLNKPIYYIDLSLNKSFNKGKYSIQLNFNDILKTRKDGNVLYNEQMIMHLLNTYDSRSLSITFRYRFNTVKEKSRRDSHINSEINRL